MSVVFASSTAGFARFFSQNGFTPIAPYLIPHYLVGTALSLQGVANVVVLPFVGLAIDAHGSRFMCWVGLGSQALANLLASGSTNIFLQMSGRIMQGCSGGIGFAAQIAFVMDNFDEPLKSQHIGTVLGATILGGMLGPPVLSSVYAATAGFAMRQAWTFLPASFILAVAIFALMRVPMRKQQPLLETHARQDWASFTSEGCLAFRFLVVYFRIGFQAALISAQLILVFGALAALQCASALFLYSSGYSPATLGAVFVPCTMIQAIVNPLAGRASGEPLNRRRLFVSSLFLLAVGLCFLFYMEVSPIAATAVALVVSSSAVAMSDAPSISFMSEFAAAKGIGNGEAITASEIAVSFGQAVGPCVGQLCLHHFGFNGLCLGISVVSAALAFVASIKLEVKGSS